MNTEDNELITRVGPGTPMGGVFRCFWLPVLASGDLAGPDAPPRRLRILGEDLVAFRDTGGAVGILQAACPHRRAKLFWGRNEEYGLRCAYHGWKFAVDGRCVDLPSEPAFSRLRDHVSARSYPALERGGLVWIHMGGGDPPPFPDYDWLHTGSAVTAATWFQRSNWLQSLEGDLDTAHVSFLHSWLDPDQGPPAFIDGYRRFIADDRAPLVEVRETEYGLVYGGRRTINSAREFYWRVSHWIAPAASRVPGGGMRFLTPIDDFHSLSCSVQTADRADAAPPPAEPLTQFAFPDGYSIDVRVLARGPENDYQIDRELQRNTTFSGIPGGPRDQDRAITETMELILDRGDEHLGTTDRAIVAMRDRLLRLAREFQSGVEPSMATRPEVVRNIRGWDFRSSEANLERALASLEDEAVVAR